MLLGSGSCLVQTLERKRRRLMGKRLQQDLKDLPVISSRSSRLGSSREVRVEGLWMRLYGCFCEAW